MKGYPDFIKRRFGVIALTLGFSMIGFPFGQSLRAQDSPAPAADAKPVADAKPGSEEKPENKPNPEKTDKSKEEKPEEPATIAVRVLALSGQYQDQVQSGSLDPTSLLLGGAPIKQKSFFKLCEYLEELATDDSIACLLFDLSDDSLAMNSAQLDEFTRRLAKFKQSKKRTIAWLENASNVHLSVAACCDHVIMADFGGADIPSAALESLFYRDAMDLLGVQASVVRAGDFKGAVEPYLNPVMSDHLRAHYLEMLQSINGAGVSRIAEGRGLTSADVRQMQAKRMLLPKEALAKGLVDQLAPFGAMKEAISNHLGQEVKWITTAQKPKKEVSFFELVGMMMAGPPSKSTKARQESIAVLHLTGDIVDGKKPSSGSIVSGPMVKAIEELEEDDKVKGVVVRINSPGGSATASEAIRQALAKLAKKKPTVISMGSVAASGGYWVTCIGEPIYAERGTVTGSIGVFAMKLSFGPLMRRVGVHVESITLDDSAAAFAMNHAWNDMDVATLQESIDEVYDRFLKLVGKSRKMPVDKVSKLAGGRVWSGEQAKARGLVDAIGGLDDCLAVVAKKAELEDYKVIHRPVPSSGFDLLELFGEADEEEIFSGATLRSMVSVLRARGFKLDTTLRLLQDATDRVNKRPTIWALHPAEISIQ